MIKECIFLISVLIAFTSVSCKPSDTTLLPLFHDIIKLIPKDKIEAIEQEHLKEDEGFRAAVLYLQSNEWRELVNSVLVKPEYVAFMTMTAKYNIDIPQGITCIRRHIDSLKVTDRPTAKPNLESFIKDVQAVLPLSEMAQVFTEKLNNAGGASSIRDEIGSTANMQIANAVRNLPETKKMTEILKGMEFDVEPYLTLIYTFLGWVR